MKNLKHTKEYAELLALEEYNETFNSRDFQIAQKNSQSGFQRGYMKAIEETAAPEMLEALIGLIKETTTLKQHCIEQGYIDWEDESIDGVKDLDEKLEIASKAITKATK
jgi:hypothetical protein